MFLLLVIPILILLAVPWGRGRDEEDCFTDEEIESTTAALEAGVTGTAERYSGDKSAQLDEHKDEDSEESVIDLREPEKPAAKAYED